VNECVKKEKERGRGGRKEGLCQRVSKVTEMGFGESVAARRKGGGNESNSSRSDSGSSGGGVEIQSQGRPL